MVVVVVVMVVVAIMVPKTIKTYEDDNTGNNLFLCSGGCPESQRPASELACDPPCSVVNSICLDTNFCGCLGDNQPVYSDNNTLLSCNMNTSSTTPVSHAL